MRRIQPHVWMSLGIFCAALLINVSITSLYPVGYADSDEIITASYLFTTAHPPGYSQQIILTGIFQHLLGLFHITPAYAANLFAAVLHSITLTLLFLTAYTLYDPRKNKLSSLVSGGVGVFVLGFNALFWLYSGVIEVMSLGNLYVGLLLYLTSRWLVDKKHNRHWITYCAIVFGLSVAHLQSTILLGPGFVVLLFMHQPQPLHNQIKQVLRILSISIASFFLANSLLLWLNGRHQPLAWDFPQTLSGLMYMIFRQDYQGTFATKGVVIDNAYANLSNILNPQAFLIYLTTMWNHMGGLPIIFCALGIFWLWKSKKTAAYGYFGLYLFSGLLFGSYVTVSTPPIALNSLQVIGISQRQYLIGYTILGLFTSLGSMFAFDRIAYYFRHKGIRFCLVFSLIFLPILAEYQANLEVANQRNNSLVSTFSKSLLNSAEPNSVIICSSDIACFNLFYQSLIAHVRPDVTVLSSIHRARKYFFEQNPQYIGQQNLPLPQFYAQQLTWNVARRPTYVIMPEDYYIKYVGLNGNPYYLYPKGYMSKVETASSSAIQDNATDDIFSLVASTTASNRNFLGLAIKDYFASLYIIKAKQYYMLNNRNEALKAADYAAYLNSTNQTIKKWQSVLIQN